MKVSDLLPEVYYKESRDFAYIGRILEIIFNYMKTASDNVGLNIDNEFINSNLIDLSVDTLGFDAKHKYVNNDLIGLVKLFNKLLKNKGMISTIDLAVRLLINSQDIKNRSESSFCEFNVEKNELEIHIPHNLSDIILLEDLFDYILPAGITYKFIKFANLDNDKESVINIKTDINNSGSNIHTKYDTELGLVDSDDSDKAIGSFYTGVVVTNIENIESTNV